MSIAALLMASSDWRQQQRLLQATLPIQAQLEAYRREYQQYPLTLSQIGIVDKEDDCIHYRRETRDGYSLWFGAHVGQPKTLH
ncbi:hypothetical protein [Roseimicrobium gellanilyticum]|uniref:hypothetical protein n=1 Tax=Roseimicrobium gellanilyticum TaxID=748857 RepID=UPI001473F0C5|nr:hypothetical protein [Roseimicrobium gellanilyticum]